MLVRILALVPFLCACQSAQAPDPEVADPEVAEPEVAEPEVAQPAAREPAAQRVQAPARDAATAVLRPEERAKPWIAGALQIESAETRRAAVETIRRAIGSDDEAEAHAGLIAFSGVQQVEFDKAPFREPALRWTRARDEWVRLRALFAVLSAGKQPGDLKLAIEVSRGMSGDPRPQMVHVLASFADMDLTGAAGEEVERILAAAGERDLRQALSGLWGTKVSGAIEARLMALSDGDDARLAHDAIYFGLSTLQDKSEPVVDRLIRALSDPDWNNSSRALWGLGQGVPPGLQGRVAGAMVKLYAARADRRTQADALRLIDRYGATEHAAALEEMSRQPGMDESERARVLDAAQRIRGRAR